jgi:carboxylesterase type B
VPDNGFTTDPFLPGSVEELLSSEQFNSDIQVIIGTNADEGILDVGPTTDGFTKWDSLKHEIDNYGPTVFFGIPPKEFTFEDVKRVNKLIDYYVGSIENINEEHKQGVIDMFTDASFQYGTHLTINHLVDQNVTLYQYLLTYQGQYSISPLFDVPVGNGVCHGDDLIYFWNSNAMGTADISSVLGNILNIRSPHHLHQFLILS